MSPLCHHRVPASEGPDLHGVGRYANAPSNHVTRTFDDFSVPLFIRRQVVRYSAVDREIFFFPLEDLTGSCELIGPPQVSDYPEEPISLVP